jgi:cellobiose epimerase
MAVEAAVVEEPARRGAARALEASLRDQVMPYWHRTTLVPGVPGYQLFDVHPRSPLLEPWRRWWSRDRIVEARRDRHLVGQCRMLFGFAHAHRHGLSTDRHDLLGAAEHGYRFLSRTMRDHRHGGFHWRADAAGGITDPRKFLYGQAFAIYALLELHRAGGQEEPVAVALDAYHRVQTRWHDPNRGGWTEDGRADFGPLSPAESAGAPEPVGVRSANANLHWVEALSELCDITGEPGVRSSLAEAVDLCATGFFPADPADACQYRGEDWRIVERSLRGVISYGHTVEFAWMLPRAERVLGRSPSWGHVDALLRHALTHGFDHGSGGFYSSGRWDRPAAEREKIWWVQAEGLAALVDRLAAGHDAQYARCLDLLLGWLRRYQILPDGIWLWSVGPAGEVRGRVKASSWKAAYHDLRAMLKFVHQYR